MKLQINNKPLFKQKALEWANRFPVCAVFDSNEYKDQYSNYECIIAAGFSKKLETDYNNAFEKLKKFREENSDWLIGGFGYDLKNDIENLTSQNKDGLNFPDCFFFVPKHLLLIKGDELQLISNNRDLYEEILNPPSSSNTVTTKNTTVPVKERLPKEQYIQKVKKIKEHITKGDIYVSNFCTEFFSECTAINPQEVYNNLNQLSESPFSGYFKWFDKYILCASPERFLARRGNKLISQPIKGTAKRGETTETDELLKTELQQHPKEQQENVMIVDLVRNDLTKSAKNGTVKVEELFGIYSFKQVHQMISTVVCEVNDNLSVTDIIKNTFPMGSMTGAPKVKAMQLMEQYEETKRGIYSGAIGYITPDDDFDFNVVIRSVLYNAGNKYLSFHAGSAITFYANAEKEYEECLLKVKALLKAVNGSII